MMKDRKLFRQAGALFAAFLIGITALTQPVRAEETERTDGSISLKYSAVAGVDFNIYLAGVADEAGEFTLTGDFADLSVNLKGLDTEGWVTAAETLAAYTKAQEIPALYSKTTDVQGKLVFDKLVPGLYLITGDTVTVDGRRYEPVPMLTALPGRDESGKWSYHIEAVPKHEVTTPTGKEKKYSVIKYWENDGEGTARPAKITVDILKDGKLEATQTLSEKNNWTYSWKALDDGSEWEVVEREVPDGYTVRLEKNDVVYQITNSYTGSEKPTDGKTVKTGGSARTEQAGKKSVKTGDSTKTELAVLGLALSGLLAVLAGYGLRRNARDEH